MYVFRNVSPSLSLPLHESSHAARVSDPLSVLLTHCHLPLSISSFSLYFPHIHVSSFLPSISPQRLLSHTLILPRPSNLWPFFHVSPFRNTHPFFSHTPSCPPHSRYPPSWHCQHCILVLTLTPAAALPCRSVMFFLKHHHLFHLKRTISSSWTKLYKNHTQIFNNLS